MNRKKEKNFFDWIGVIIALLCASLFGVLFIVCYVYFFKHPSIATLIGAIFTSIIPGLITYGIIGSIRDFFRDG